MRIAAALVVAQMALPVNEPATGRIQVEHLVLGVWSDTVKRGKMLRHVRGLGEIKNRQTVALRIAETQVKDGWTRGLDRYRTATQVGGQGHAGWVVSLEWSGHCGRTAECPTPSGTKART